MIKVLQIGENISTPDSAILGVSVERVSSNYFIDQAKLHEDLILEEFCYG